VTAAQYEANLEANLSALRERIKSGRSLTTALQADLATLGSAATPGANARHGTQLHPIG